jgi:hypothetical protein
VDANLDALSGAQALAVLPDTQVRDAQVPDTPLPDTPLPDTQVPDQVPGTQVPLPGTPVAEGGPDGGFPDEGQFVAGHLTRRQRGAADRLARRLLRIQEPLGEPDVHNIFSSSIALSATRCLLSYIVLPSLSLLAPWIRTVPLIGPAIGVPIGLLALVFDVRAIRRFFQAEHRWRWVATALYVAVMIMVATFVLRDIARLT